MRPCSISSRSAKVIEELRHYLSDAVNYRWMLLEALGSAFHRLDGDQTSIAGSRWERWLDLSGWEIRKHWGLLTGGTWSCSTSASSL